MNARPKDVVQLALLDTAALREFDWQVRSSPRARRLTARVFPGGGVEIVVPRGTGPRTVERFVTRHRDWIERKVQQFQPLDGALDAGIPDSIRFEATGECWEVIAGARAGSAPIREEGQHLLLPRECPQVVDALQRWLVERARRALLPRLQQLSAETSLAFTHMQVRRQRTRWGSCSRRGTISLNACLVFQRPAVVRYLLVHELAHTRHLNHSAEFWALVAQIEPGWRALDQELASGWRNVPAWALRSGPAPTAA